MRHCEEQAGEGEGRLVGDNGGRTGSHRKGRQELGWRTPPHTQGLTFSPLE